MNNDWVKAAQASWRWRGQDRPPFAEEPGPGQESVWDYSRPPSVEPVAMPVRVEFDGRVIAESTRAMRVLETASGPAVYLPFDDIDMTLLSPEPSGSVCEWKGPWVYWSLKVDDQIVRQVGWGYTELWAGFEPIRDHLSFYPAKVDCWLGEQRVSPQPGRFYGGWVTPEIVGPMKGDPGSQGW